MSDKKTTFSVRKPNYDAVFTDSPEMAEIATDRWKVAVEHLKSTGNLTKARVFIADRYARASAEFEMLHPVAAAQGPVKIGETGGEFFNYIWSAVEKLNDRIAKFEAKLKMDVAEVAPGQAVRAAVTDADKYLGD